MSKSIFAQVFETHPLTAFPTTIAKPLTPEEARREGERAGVSAALNFAIDLLQDIKKPSKQVLAIIATLEQAGDE